MLCSQACWENSDETVIIRVAQTQQNAQAGYAADDQCKRSAQSFNEVTEAKKGHHAMAEKITNMRLSYIGHRHVTRILSDYYGKGIVRSNQESTNLRAWSRSDDVTAAECIKSNKNVVVPAAEALFIIETVSYTHLTLPTKRIV